MAKETKAFQAEIQQLLNLMIHSLYSHREIFLRELISNASDAIDKLKFEAISKADLIPEGRELNIRLQPDKEKKTLSIIDRGIGMSRDEVIENIGTIAKSGTKAFMEMSQQIKERPELIGQFGVGFYSAFMVAEKVVLHTQKAGSNEGVLWQSTGDGQFTIEEVPRAEGTGTTITLHLKDFAAEEEESDFTDEWTIKGLVKKYSDFIPHPIVMKVEKEKTTGEGDDKKTEKYLEDETLNSMKALWVRQPSEISDEEYNEFYRHITHDWEDPFKRIHFRAEGTMEFSSILYFPKKKPWNFYFKDTEYGLNLYVKRVFIMGDCKDLLPSYLRFVKGVVDSSDLSLNVSREMLQHDRQVAGIRKSLVGKILGTLSDMLKKEREDYEKFWAEFGPSLKEGIPSDYPNQDKIKELLLFHSTHSDKLTTLAEYKERMKEGQKEIYFITGDRLDQLKASPYLERLAEKNYEVLLLTDPVDEFVVQQLTEYQTTPLKSVTKENLDLDTEEEKKAKEEKRKEAETQFKPVLEGFKEALKDQVRDVRISDRLKDSPVCLVSGEYDPSAQMEKLMNQMGQTMPGAGSAKRIMEINPDHPVFKKIQSAEASKQKLFAEILYGQALLTEGSSLPDPHKFSKQISDLMSGQLS